MQSHPILRIMGKSTQGTPRVSRLVEHRDTARWQCCKVGRWVHVTRQDNYIYANYNDPSFLISQAQSLTLPSLLQHRSSPHYLTSIFRFSLTTPMSLVHSLPLQLFQHLQQPQLLHHVLAQPLPAGDVAKEWSVLSLVPVNRWTILIDSIAG